MMNSDELRALADALIEYGEDAWPTPPEPIQRAAAYLRACADAKPVAWRCEVRGDGTDPKLGAVGWRHYSTTTSEREAQAFVARCGDGIEGRAVPLYPHTAPAVPAGYKLVPVEPTPEMLASTSWPGCARTDYAHMLAAAPAAPQAEPKREPLSDERIDKLIIKVFGPNADIEWHTELVRAVEHAYGIGGSDAE